MLVSSYFGLEEKAMKKIGKIFVFILCVCIIAFFGYCYWLSRASDDGIESKAQMDYLNNDVDLEVLLYGNEIELPEEFNYNKIEDLDEKKWKLENDYVFLIVNDLDSSIEFTKEQATKIKEYADKNTNFNFFYIGSEKLDLFYDIYKDCNIDKKTDLSFGYAMIEGTRLLYYGLWSIEDQKYMKGNPLLLGEEICDSLERIVRSNE